MCPHYAIDELFAGWALACTCVGARKRTFQEAYYVKQGEKKKVKAL